MRKQYSPTSVPCRVKHPQTLSGAVRHRAMICTLPCFASIGVLVFSTARAQWRREGEGGGEGALALSMGRHFEGRKYGILKIGRFWRIEVCIAERIGS